MKNSDFLRQQLFPQTSVHLSHSTLVLSTHSTILVRGRRFLPLLSFFSSNVQKCNCEMTRADDSECDAARDKKREKVVLQRSRSAFLCTACKCIDSQTRNCALTLFVHPTQTNNSSKGVLSFIAVESEIILQTAPPYHDCCSCCVRHERARSAQSFKRVLCIFVLFKSTTYARIVRRHWIASSWLIASLLLWCSKRVGGRHHLWRWRHGLHWRRRCRPGIQCWWLHGTDTRRVLVHARLQNNDAFFNKSTSH